MPNNSPTRLCDANRGLTTRVRDITASTTPGTTKHHTERHAMAQRQHTCAHCGNPQRGSAQIDHAPVCHPDEPEYPDCYRLVTVYHEPLGIRIRQPGSTAHILKQTYIYIGEQHPIICVSTIFNAAHHWEIIEGYRLSPWQSHVVGILEDATPTRRYQSRDEAIHDHASIVRDTIDNLKAIDWWPLLVTESGPQR